jgi:predicted homoserine dehydrogenase-like protein
MIITDSALKKRELSNTPIRVAIIGAGAMGTGMVNQITRHTPGMQVVALYNRTIKKAEEAFRKCGITEFKVAGNIGTAQNAISSGKPVIVDDIELLLELQGIDVLVETTGTIEFALKTILSSFDKGINVLSFNAELDSDIRSLS